MDNITLNQLTNCMWYVQQLLVKDEKDSILFTGENWKLQSENYKEIRGRWIRSFGSLEDVMIVKLI